jgi:hypothetical protein
MSSVLLILSFFLYFSWSRLAVHFAADDVMNLGRYFGLGPWRALANQALLWRNAYRPMGAAFYLPMFYLFGLNPKPYQAAIMVLLAINTYLVYRVSRSLRCSKLVSGLTALVTCYHPGLSNLQYDIDMIYDVLCFGFYFSALAYYLRIRERQLDLTVWRMGGLLVLYVCALNSKEMAVSFPVVLLAYEVLYGDPPRHRLLRWICTGPRRVSLFTGVLTLMYIYGRTVGPNALAKHPAYHPVFSAGRLVAFQIGSLDDILFFTWAVGWIGALAAWVCFTCLAWRCDRPVLRFAWLFALVTPLPIEFLEGRFQGCLYIPMVAWALLASTVLVEFANAANRVLLLILPRLNRPITKNVVLCGVVMVAVLLWARETAFLHSVSIVPAGRQEGLLTWETVQQLKDLNPHVRRGSEIVVLDDPFTFYDMAFIIELWFRDRTLSVHLQRLNPQPPEQIAKADHIFKFEEGRLRQLR